MITRAFFRLLGDTNGAAAAEMVLVLPLLLVIMFGSVELGNYMLNEHTLLRAVRDGARYAARQPFASYSGCNGTAAGVPSAVSDNTKLLVRKGTLNSADPDQLSNWTDASTQFSVQMSRSTAA